MKKVFLILTIVATFGCKGDKKETDNTIEQKEPVKKEVSTNINFPAYPGWGKVGVEITETSETFLDQKAYKLSRSSIATQSSFAHTQKIGVNDGDIYRASIIVKRGEKNSLFGLRISGDYPDRVDAVFDLEEGIVKGVKKGRDFESENANIEDLGDGWYKCSVVAEVAAYSIQIIFGPTTEDMSVNGWEGKTTVDCDSFILPLSLELENISFE